jgi:hypothetical protein
MQCLFPFALKPYREREALGGVYRDGNLKRFTGVIDIPADDFEGGGSSLRSQFLSQLGGQKNRLDLLADLRDTPSETGDAASRLQATELCVTLRVTEDLYIIVFS